jgi:hypothetical protein
VQGHEVVDDRADVVRAVRSRQPVPGREPGPSLLGTDLGEGHARIMRLRRSCAEILA